MPRYLVTGGGGFIGSHLAGALVADGAQVRVLDDFSTGRRENLTAFESQIELVEGSICDPEKLPDAMDGVDYCLHQAAIPSVPRSVANPMASNEANVDGSLRVYLAARDAGVKRVVVASSSSVYGPDATMPCDESAPVDPASPYAVTKATDELYARVVTDLYDLDVVCLRYFNVFGPRQDPASEYAAVIPKFIECLRGGKPATIHGDGRQSRDFTYIDNVVQANLAACHYPGSLSGNYNIACGVAHTVLEIHDAISEALGVSIVPEHTPPRPGDVPRSLARIDKAREAFGYDPAIDFDEGLRRTVEWYLAQPVLQ